MSELSGFSYPFQIDEATGGLKLSKGSKVKHENIKSLIETMFNERVLNPEYGTPLYLFDVIQNLSLVNFQLENAIAKYVPDITSEVTSSITEDGDLDVVINWRWLETPQDQQETINLVINF